MPPGRPNGYAKNVFEPYEKGRASKVVGDLCFVTRYPPSPSAAGTSRSSPTPLLVAHLRGDSSLVPGEAPPLTARARRLGVVAVENRSLELDEVL